MFVVKLTVILCAIQSALGQGWNQPSGWQSQNTCTTPRYEIGTCVVIQNCAPLLALISRTPISEYNGNYLRQSACGFAGNQPKVCCPPSSNYAAVASSAPVHSGSLLPGRNVCGVGTNDRIYGGEKCELDEFPWMALLEYTKPKGKGFYCGGVLISDRYILTAAHCIAGKDLPKTWRLTSVRLGEYNTDTDQDCDDPIPGGSADPDCADPPVDVRVEQQIVHEDYNPNNRDQQNDIALLRLERSVQYTDFIKPICLPNTPSLLTKSFVGEKLFVAGWGKTETRSESNVKLKLQVPVVSNEICSPVYAAASVDIGNGQMCAGGERGRDSCRGDSGGPLMVHDQSSGGRANWVVAGVVSFGPSPCGMEGWPGVYTKVQDFIPWIESKLRP